MQLEIVSPLADARFGAVLDAAFQRTGSEARLAAELARAHPDFDPGLALLATEGGAALGAALFLPRTIRLRGAWVRVAIAAPVGVHPAAHRRGVGSFLLRTGLGALRDRGLRAAITIGAPEFHGAFGFESAFNAYAQRVPVQSLPPEGDTSSWRGLAERDLALLPALHAACSAGVSGCERRHAAAIEWESAASGSYTLVSERDGAFEAMLRFRVRAEIELTEGVVASSTGVDAVLRFLRRVAREHARSRVDTHLPPAHPVARELFRRGAVNETNRLGGAARMCVVDWPGLFADTAESWLTGLERARVDAVSFPIGGVDHALSRRGAELRVDAGKRAPAHFEVPAGWSAGLLTGQLDHHDLAFVHGADAELARALFPGETPQWSYAPIFEVADE
ncbi:MAG: GNAT family N-acetyltransferase [Planctomycetes bacterium]|nr:GNAT family N-acetyltransferase [Planctomycetota bacterium]